MQSIIIHIIVFFLAGMQTLHASPQAVRITHNIPKHLQVGKTYNINISIDKGDLVSYADFKQKLPKEWAIAEISETGNKQSLENNILKIQWLRLPENQKINIRYKLKIPEEAQTGKFSFYLNFSYIFYGRHGQASEKVTAVVVESGKKPSEELHKENIGRSSEKTEQKQGNTKTQNREKQEEKNSEKSNVYGNKEIAFSCKRKVSGGKNAAPYKVELSIDNQADGAIVKVIEYLPDGFKAKASEKGGMQFKQEGDGMISFYTQNLAAGKHTISYELVAPGDKKPGQYAGFVVLVKDNIQKRVTIKDAH